MLESVLLGGGFAFAAAIQPGPLSAFLLSRAAAESSGSAPRNLVQAVTVNLLNPNPYLGWALVLGPAAVAAWRLDPARAIALVASFYGTMVLALSGFIVLAGNARALGSSRQRSLVLISVLILAGLGLS